jgi:hypothetical protein
VLRRLLQHAASSSRQAEEEALRRVVEGRMRAAGQLVLRRSAGRPTVCIQVPAEAGGGDGVSSKDDYTLSHPDTDTDIDTSALHQSRAHKHTHAHGDWYAHVWVAQEAEAGEEQELSLTRTRTALSQCVQAALDQQRAAGVSAWDPVLLPMVRTYALCM